MTDEPKVQFVVGEALMMRDLLRAEASNFVAIELMAKYAVKPDGSTMTRDEMYEIINDMNELEYMVMWQQFRAASVPKVSGRH